VRELLADVQQIPAGRLDRFRLMNSPDHDWLKTSEGRAWLESAEGVEWERSDEGWAWMHSPDGREWLDELAQRGYERYFSGEALDPPEWAITPDTAPKIGSRVRLTEGSTTLGGTSFADGELMIVDELRYSPVGIVWVHLRAVNGRQMVTGKQDTFVLAT
jgi:hypothetical protein